MNYTLNRKVTLLPEDALYIGVRLVGNCRLEDGILSGFDTTPSRADLPFLTPTWDCPWEICLKWRKTTNTGWQGLVSAVIDNGWSPIGFTNGVVCYLHGVGTPVQWDTTIAEDAIAFTFSKNIDYITRVAFNGSCYNVSLKEGGLWKEKARKSTTDIVSASGQTINIGLNRGINAPFDGIVDLNYSYIRRDGILLWEGIPGAYENVLAIKQ